MKNQHPFLEISSPVGEDWVYKFNSNGKDITLGRLEDNDMPSDNSS